MISKAMMGFPFRALMGLLLVSGAMAQPAQPTKKDPFADRGGRKAWFVAVSIPKGLKNPIHVLADKDIQMVTLSKRSVSDPVKIPSNGVLHIVRPHPDPAQATFSPYEVLGQVRIPETMRDAMILMVPAKNEVGPDMFKFRVQDLATFKGGDILYMNLSPKNIRVLLGEDRVALKPGAVKIHESEELSAPVNVPIAYQVYDEQRKRWNLLSASTVVMRGKRREMCVFYMDERYQRLNYHGITFPVQ